MPRARRRPDAQAADGGPRPRRPGELRPLLLQARVRPLAERAQVVYLDLRHHGRSEWGEPEEWSFERCADDVHALCEALGIDRPVVFGHSMGVPVVLLYGACYPGHAAGIVAQSGFARFDLRRLVEGVRRAAGDDVAELARRGFDGGEVTPEEWARVFAAFGPRLPDAAELARRRQNPAIGPRGLALMCRLDVLDRLDRVESPTLVSVGALDPVTPPAASEEIVGALPAGIGRLDVLEGAGHFPWKDVPARYWRRFEGFLEEVSGG